MNSNNIDKTIFTELTQEWYVEAAKCLSKQFTEYEPMGKLLNLTADLFYKVAMSVVQAASNGKLSFVAINPKTEKLLGVLIGEDLYDYIHNDQPSIVDLYPETKPIFTLLDKLTHEYYFKKNPQRGQVCHLFMVAVYPGGKLGTSVRLSKHFIKKAVEYNYGEVVAEPTGRISQGILGLSNMDIINEIEYSKFQLDGEFPFKDIEDTPVCQLRAMKLNGVI